ncbi:MAG: hypothetical protein AAB551_01870 [Patescibacteria group bacterium]
MKIYQAKSKKIAGTEFKEVRKKAFEICQEIKRRSKRRAYVRSSYFKKDKIFIDLFWEHLFDKQSWKDRVRRLKYFPAAIEPTRKSPFEPRSKENPNKKNEILHRFAGMTQEKDLFFVQIKEDKKSCQKFFISVFPAE